MEKEKERTVSPEERRTSLVRNLANRLEGNNKADSASPANSTFTLDTTATTSDHSKKVAKPTGQSKATGATGAQKATAPKGTNVGRASLDPPSPQAKLTSRGKEAKELVTRGKASLSQSRNTKKEITEEVKKVLEDLYKMVKELDAENQVLRQRNIQSPSKPQKATPTTSITPEAQLEASVASRLEQHTQMLLENSRKLDELKAALREQAETAKTCKPTYAEVAESRGPRRETLHSVVITAADETESGEEVMEKVRQAVDAKDGWIRVERVRKAKDRRIIMGVGTLEERNKLKKRIEERARDLTVEEIKNKDPMLVLKDVLKVNSNEDIIRALENQNREVFHGLDSGDTRITVKYRKRARNSLTEHVVVSVSPAVWQRVTLRGFVHIDLQRIRVEDQSPLVQCTRCLGYGHGRRFCRETADSCSHCGGPHLRAECAEWRAGEPPSCRNCTKTGQAIADHNAFSVACPTRKKWDKLARASVAYHC